MANVREIEFGAFVVKVAFVGGNPAFALGDGTVRLIKRAGERVAEVHDGAVLTAVSNGKDMVTGGDDGRVAVIAADGGVRTVAERPRKWIDQVAIGPDGSIAFATGREAVVVGRDGAKKTFDHPRAVGGIAFAPKGFRLAVARYDGVTLWWAGTDAKPAMLDWKGAHIGISFSPDGKNLVTAMQENALHGWRLSDGRDTRMSGYPSKPRSLSWAFKGRYLASSGANAAILWPFFHKDGPMGREPLQLGAREALVTCVACHPRQAVVAAGYQDGTIQLLGFEDAEEGPLRDGSDDPVSALAWDQAGTRLAFGTEAGAGGIVELAAS